MDEHELFRQLGKIFEDAGHQLFLVGGSVRDRMLNRESKDLDFTTDALPDQISDLLRPSKGGWADAIWDIGREFGTIALRKDGHDIEITTFRTDGPGRKPEVKFTDDLLEDLKRRDFTINAMAMPVDHLGLHKHGVDLVDPFHGMMACVQDTLDTPGMPEITFSDDPLRMLRAARFASQLGFTVAPRVVKAMEFKAPCIEQISKERIVAEMDKLLVGMLPERGIELLSETGILAEILPGVSGDDVFIGFKVDVNVAWARLLRDQRPVDVMNLLKGLKMSSERMSTVTTLVDLTQRWGTSGRSDVTLRHIIHNAGDLLELLLDHWNDVDTLDAVLVLLAREGAPQLPLNGKQIMETLGIKPGPAIGEAQKFLWNRVLCTGPMTEEEARTAIQEVAFV